MHLFRLELILAPPTKKIQKREMGNQTSKLEYLEPLSERKRFREHLLEVQHAPRHLAECANRIITSRDDESATDVEVWNQIVRCLIVLGRPDFSFDNARKAGQSDSRALTVATTVGMLKAACAAVKHSKERNAVALFQLGQTLELTDMRQQAGLRRGWRTQTKASFGGSESLTAERAFAKAAKLQHKPALSHSIQYRAAQLVSRGAGYVAAHSGDRNELVLEHIKFLSDDRDDQQLWVSLSSLLDPTESLVAPTGETLSKLQCLCNAVECDDRDPWLWGELVQAASSDLLHPDSLTDFSEPAQVLTIRGAIVEWVFVLHTAIARNRQVATADEVRVFELLRGERTVEQVTESTSVVWNALGLLIERASLSCSSTMLLNGDETSRRGFFNKYIPAGMSTVEVLVEILNRSSRRPALWMVLAAELGREDLLAYRRYVASIRVNEPCHPWNVLRDEASCRNGRRVQVNASDLFVGSRSCRILNESFSSTDCAIFSLSLRSSFEPWLLMSQVTSVEWVCEGMSEESAAVVRRSATVWGIPVVMPSINGLVDELRSLEFLVETNPPREVALGAWTRLAVVLSEAKSATRELVIPSCPPVRYSSAMAFVMAIGCVDHDTELECELKVLLCLSLLGDSRFANAHVSAPHSPTYYTIDCLEDVIRLSPNCTSIVECSNGTSTLLARAWEVTCLMLKKHINDRSEERRILTARCAVADAMWSRCLCDHDRTRKCSLDFFLFCCHESADHAAFDFSECSMARLLWCIEDVGATSEVAEVARRVCCVAFMTYIFMQKTDPAYILLTQKVDEEWTEFRELVPSSSTAGAQLSMLCSRKLASAMTASAPGVFFENVFLCLCRMCTGTTDIVKLDASRKLLALLSSAAIEDKFWGAQIFPSLAEIAHVQLAMQAGHGKLDLLLTAVKERPCSSAMWGRIAYLNSRSPNNKAADVIAREATESGLMHPLVFLARCVALCVAFYARQDTTALVASVSAAFSTQNAVHGNPSDRAVILSLVCSCLAQVNLLGDFLPHLGLTVIEVKALANELGEFDVGRAISEGLRLIDSASISVALRDEMTSDLLTLAAAVEVERCTTVAAAADVVLLLTQAVERNADSIILAYVLVRYFDEMQTPSSNRVIVFGSSRVPPLAFTQKFADKSCRWSAHCSEWMWTQCAKELLLSGDKSSVEPLLKHVCHDGDCVMRANSLRFWSALPLLDTRDIASSVWHMLVAGTKLLESIVQIDGVPKSSIDITAVALSTLVKGGDNGSPLVRAAWGVLALSLFVSGGTVAILGTAVDLSDACKVTLQLTDGDPSIRSMSALLLSLSKGTTSTPEPMWLHRAYELDRDCTPAVLLIEGRTPVLHEQHLTAVERTMSKILRAQLALEAEPSSPSQVFYSCIEEVLVSNPTCEEAWALLARADKPFNWHGASLLPMDLKKRVRHTELVTSVLAGALWRQVALEWCQRILQAALLQFV